MTIFPSILWKQIVKFIPHSEGWEFKLHFLEGEYLHLEFLCKGDFPPPPQFIYWFNHLFIALWTSAYLFFTVGYDSIITFLFKMFQHWPLGLFQVSSCVLSTYPLPIPYQFLTFWHNMMLQAHLILYFPCPGPRIRYFSKDPSSLLLENDINNEDLGAEYLHLF